MSIHPRTLLPAALLLFGCRLHRRAAAPEPPRGPARDSLFALDQTRTDSATARGPVDGLLSLLGPEVVFLRAGVPTVYGREAARALVSAPEMEPPRTWQPLGGNVSYDLRDGYTFGIAARMAAPRAIRLERYIAYWRRARGQPWRIVAYVELGGRDGVDMPLTADQLTPPVGRMSNAAVRSAAAVRAADSTFSDLADRMGPGYAVGHTIAPDGAVFGGSQLLFGPRAIEEYFAAQAPGTSVTWRPVTAWAATSGDLGFTVGESISTGRGPSGAAVQRFGKYLSVWKREGDGKWKLAIGGGNETPSKAER